MTAKLYICNSFGDIDEFSLKSCKLIQHQTTPFSSNSINLQHYNIGDFEIQYLLKELKCWNNFRRSLRKILQENHSSLQITVIPTKQDLIDYKWNYITMKTLWEKIEIENLMSWMSTLGGGFSALGDTHAHHAKTAGKISMKQLLLGLKIGDPFLQARCKLFYSISLIQTQKLQAAKHVILEQYEFAKKQKEIDNRLVKMCQGIWLKLQYECLKRKLPLHNLE